jgi:hypothetical protein
MHEKMTLLQKIGWRNSREPKHDSGTLEQIQFLAVKPRDEMAEYRPRLGFRRHALGLVGAVQLAMLTPMAHSQTNTPCPPRHLFSCPVPYIDPAPKVKPAFTNTPAITAEVERKAGTEDAERYHWMNGRFLLQVPVHSEQGGALGWIERKMEPEVVQFRKVTMTGSLVTAIKRKNPLYLLQPVPFFDMDW